MRHSISYRGVEIRPHSSADKHDYPWTVIVRADERYGADDLPTAMTIIDQEVPSLEYRGVSATLRDDDWLFEVNGEVFRCDALSDLIAIIDEEIDDATKAA